MKTCNMRGGGVGDIGVFPREYQSGTSAPAPENVTSFKKMGRLPARSKIAGKAIFLWNVTGEGVFGELTSKSGILANITISLIRGNTQIW